mmetsp:Transcript_29108/g.40934  ORF Transcript_29108/g.40934 Transcript_29108/m.40934 type:complete len:219 (-) Transcript_29108:404-1060(-)
MGFPQSYRGSCECCCCSCDISYNANSSGRIVHNSSRRGGRSNNTPAWCNHSSTARSSMYSSSDKPCNLGHDETTFPSRIAIKAGISFVGLKLGKMCFAKSAFSNKADFPAHRKNLVPRLDDASFVSKNKSRDADFVESSSKRCNTTAGGGGIADLGDDPNPAALRTRAGCNCRCAPYPCCKAASRCNNSNSNSARRRSSISANILLLMSPPGKSSSNK